MNPNKSTWKTERLPNGVVIEHTHEQRREGIEHALWRIGEIIKDVQSVRSGLAALESRELLPYAPQHYGRLGVLLAFADSLAGRVAELRMAVERDLNGGVR